MRDPRVFHPRPLVDAADVELGRDAVRHLVKVLRVRTGGSITLFDGTGREWPATLLDARRGIAHTGASAVVDRESPLAITLVQGISRGDRMDTTIRKAVELGAAAIQPVFSERSVVRLDQGRGARRAEHWRGVAVAACEQCGRNVVPPVYDPVQLADWLRAPPPATLILDPTAPDTLAAVPAADALTLLTGPEGGFSDGELAAARDAGCRPVRIGPRILRTETAGVAALAALQALFGDM